LVRYYLYLPVPSPLANQTVARIKQSLRTGTSASLPEVIRLIEELSSRAFSIAVHELADLISRDAMVTAKVLQTSNTFGYNPCGQPVTTVTQAIQVVGFNKIRNLALSMLLIDKATQSGQSESVRESAALALCSGLFAQAVTSICPEHDSEQAFVFACLRHYGRLLLCTFLPEDFSKVQNRSANQSEADSCREVFGLTPLDLTHRLFEETNMPRAILRCLQDIPNSQIAQSAANQEEALAVLAQFASELGELVVSANIGAADFAPRAEKLRQRYNNRFQLSSDAVDLLLRAVDQNVRLFARTYGTRQITESVLERISARTSHAELIPELPTVRLTKDQLAEKPSGDQSVANNQVQSAADGSVRGQPDTPLQPVDACAILTDALLHLTEMSIASIVDQLAMETVVVEAILRAFSLQNCILFAQDGSRTTFTSKLGRGPLFDLVRGRPLVATGRRDVFSICLSRREDVLIRDTSDEKIRPYIPEWMHAAGAVGTFMLLPVCNEYGPFSLLLATRSNGQPLSPTQKEIQLAKALRHHLVAARRLAASGMM
jgi:HD-like signal output (HDOD) protein